jgi:hypothetical protein
MSSAWNWNNGQPSIFAPLQVHAAIAAKASKNLSAKLGTKPDPVPTLRKKRDNSKRTVPLVDRINFAEVRAYRMTGKSWAECAEKFKCSVKHIHERSISLYPELRSKHYGKPAGNKPKPLPMLDIIGDIMAGESLRSVSRKYGISHVSLRYRLMQLPEGVEAVRVAARRFAESNARLKAEAKKRKAK